MTLPPRDAFSTRHIGPSRTDVSEMLASVGLPSLDALVAETLPASIRYKDRDGRHSVPDGLPAAATEVESLAELAAYAAENQVFKSWLGQGFHGCHTPPVVLRNVIENPGWYTAYTPYQAEISQGRLEALLVFQTVVQELTGLEIASASLLDEATAAAEAMTMAHRLVADERTVCFADERLHPHVLAVLHTRAEPLGIEIRVGHADQADLDGVFVAIVPYPCTDGSIPDLEAFVRKVHDQKALVVVDTDLLASILIKPAGELGADIAIGNSQRFGVPLGYGGPHAGFMATRHAFQRQMPGRIIGISRDTHGHPALRMALQTREQHIRRQKATSNICTAQVLLAVCAGFYAVWHGPEGLTSIARRTHGYARAFALGVRTAGFTTSDTFFDTVRVDVGGRQQAILDAAHTRRVNLRPLGDGSLVVALDETTTDADLADLLAVFGSDADPRALLGDVETEVDGRHRRTSPFLREPVFHRHRSETEMLRFLHRLQARDLALDTSMIPLGSCTMKLNATSEMIPVTWPGFNALHPFAPAEQARGYGRLFAQLEGWLAAITGFDAVSLQPNAGSQGEYAGLLAIRGWHTSRGEHDVRTVCLIPTSAHGTNPASAVMVGMEVVTVACDDSGNVDLGDLRAKVAEHGDRLGALMVTYPSTHGVFEEGIVEVCRIVHEAGGLVYMDGANMNAMVGLCRPGDVGADVCHLNLHKTFCIPHGGGGPGMGPIGVRAHLAPFLPGHPEAALPGTTGAVSAAPWGSASILPISWAYIRMMGGDGLCEATRIAILNANYVAHRLEPHYPVLYRGRNGRVAHECILDLRPFKDAGVQVEDVAKRLMDYGFHAPTMSFPVVGTLMVEPTESESKAELDRFCDAMIAIREEIRAIERGTIDAAASALRHAPHTAADVTRDDWDRAYGRQQAAFPAPWTKAHKYWPTVGRIDNAFGDRHLVCSCDAWPEEA